MIRRNLQGTLEALAGRHPVVTITGPRQSGKTTLCRMTFPKKRYVSLEPPDIREYAIRDPRGFLAEHRAGAVFDEVQRAPSLLSYLQGDVDERPEPGRFILTGSQHFGLIDSIAQSLAGRSAVVHLLPLSFDEVLRFPGASSSDLPHALWMGAYPPVHDRRLPPGEWLSSYVTTYVERDVRQLLKVGDLLAFQTFLRACAGRTGQLLNLSALASDCGITHPTARAWLSVLEASFILFRLPPFHDNFGKRLVKTPKLHFFDAGLAAHLLGIRDAADLRHHPLRGALFESWVVSEAYKAHVHRGLRPDLFFFRDSRGLEVDLLVHRSHVAIAAEIKSGMTVQSDFFTSLDSVAGLFEAKPKAARVERVLVYGGDHAQRRSGVTVVPWRDVADVAWAG